MTQLAIHFVDPSIPGLSGRDLLLRLSAFARSGGAKTANALSGARREIAQRRALADLDRNQLRDIGLDQDAM